MPENKRIPVRRNKRTPAGQKGKSMKIIFYGTRDYDHLYFDVLAADPDYGCTIKFLAANLEPGYRPSWPRGGEPAAPFVKGNAGPKRCPCWPKRASSCC